MEQVTGIEPVSQLWQSCVLAVILHLHMEPVDGLEPPTYCLQGNCTTNCAIPAKRMRHKGSSFLVFNYLSVSFVVPH